MATYSNAARAVGVRKRRQPLPEALSDSRCTVRAPPRTPRGLRPCEPTKNPNQNLSKKENQRGFRPPPVGGPGAGLVRERKKKPGKTRPRRGKTTSCSGRG